MSLRRTVAVVAATGALVLVPAVASAHPLGNFTVNVYSGIELTPGHVRIDYVLDVAEIPTIEERPAIDADGDGRATQAELAAWAERKAGELAANASLAVDGRQTSLRVVSAAARFRPGQAELSTIRLEATFEGVVERSGAIDYRDRNYTDVRGWHEITAVGRDGVVLLGSTVPARSVSNALLAYPQDLLSSPLRVTEAGLSFRPGASTNGPAATGTASDARPGVEATGFTALVGNQGVPLVVLAFVLAMGFGAWHALLPGHGKTLMAAYMLGAGGRVRQAVAVGSAVAVMHTASVLGLGLVVLSLERAFTPDRVYPWLGLASGLVALVLGAVLLIGRLGTWSEARRGLAHDHEHPHALPDDPLLSRKGLVALAVAGGILPAPSALLVMLGAIQAHRVAFGLALVLAFSAGLAGSLIAVGLTAIRARDAVSARLSSGLGRLLPVLSAAAIVAVGLFLVARGLVQL